MYPYDHELQRQRALQDRVDAEASAHGAARLSQEGVEQLEAAVAELQDQVEYLMATVAELRGA